MTSSNATSENGDFFITQAVLVFTISTPAIITNALLLITIYRDPNRNQRIRQMPVTLLVLNLSICDLLACLFAGCGSLYYNISILKGQTRENLFGTQRFVTVSAVVTNVVSSCTITAMAFDRLFAVSSPLQYRAWVSKAKIKSFIAVIWIYSLLFSSLSLMGVPSSLYTLLYCHLHVSVPLISVSVVYWKTYRALRLHNNRVRNVVDGHGGDQMCMAHRTRERKMISAFLLVIFSFYAAFTPQFIAHNMVAIYPLYINQESFQSFLSTSNKILLINCSLNPVIYAWKIPNFRRAFREVFSGCVCQSRDPVNHVNVIATVSTVK